MSLKQPYGLKFCRALTVIKFIKYTQGGPMSRKLIAWMLFLFICLMPIGGMAEPLGKLSLKDGSQLYVEVLEMTEGFITVKTLFHDGDPITIKWSEVVGLTSEEPVTVVLNSGTILQGKPSMLGPGTLGITTDMLGEPIPVAVESVMAINPPIKQAVAYSGNINFGASIITGNTKLKTYSFLGELVARSERLRLTILGRYLNGETDGTLNVRNAFGTIKLDFFITKRFYAYAGALFEQDTFQDLNLRTSLFAGPGYQLIDIDDFSSPYFNKMQLGAEIGLGFFNEDFKLANDRNNVTGRWAVNFNWPVIPALTLFHQHQGFPSLEKSSDYYITSQQGLRWTMLENFISTLQYNWRYDNTPAPGTKKTDKQILLTIGYAFGP
jgi:putative salt-induced outer membrane protein YdiY